MTQSIEKGIREIVNDQMQREINNRGLATKSYVSGQVALHNEAHHRKLPKVPSSEELNVQYDLRERVAALERQVRCLFATIKEKPQTKKRLLLKEKDTLDELVEEFLNRVPVGISFDSYQKDYVIKRLQEVL